MYILFSPFTPSCLPLAVVHRDYIPSLEFSCQVELCLHWSFKVKVSSKLWWALLSFARLNPCFLCLGFFFGGTKWRAGGLFHLYGNRLHRKVEVYYVTWQHDVLYFTSFLQPLLVAARRIIFRQMALSFFSITIHFPTLSLMGNKLSVIFFCKRER